MPTYVRMFCLILLVAARGPALAQSSAFRAEGKQFSVTTATVEIAVVQGALRHIRDLRTGEVFVAGDAAVKEIPSGFSSTNDLYWFRRWWTEKPSQYATEAKYQGVRRRPVAGSKVDVRQLGPTHARLVYGGLSNGDTRDTLTYDLRIESATGEILLQATAEVTDPAVAPVTVDVPIVGFGGPSAILGSGAKYDRGEPLVVDCTTRVSNGLYSPNMAILQGESGCIAVWAEAHRFEPANVYLAHRESDDTLILNGTLPYGGLASGVDPKVLKSPVWRIGAFPTWADAARRYRELLEKRTGAKPLWEHSCRWVREIHAVDTNVPLPKQSEQYYDELAKRVDPSKLLLFYWNGSYIVLFGDHRYQKATRTKPSVIAALKKRGFRWMGYHPYTLLMPPHVKDKRLEEIAARGHLPEGYTFQPDYGGPPEELYDYFRPIATGYYKPIGEARLWVLHAGTKRFQDYWARNFGNYCKTHQMDGAYMDILGCNGGHQFPPEKKVMEGLDWRQGEAAAMKALRAKVPDRAIMSEYQTEVTLSHAFYSWTGTGHVTRTKEVRTRLNHPLRTALWGSYTWTRADDIDPVGEALIGGLPPMRLAVGKDGEVAEDEWRTAVCRLFTEEELVNDLPTRWDDDALAYYRGRGGKWFQFSQLPFGDGYVELTDDGYRVRAARFRGQNESPLDTPVEIQQWVGYRNGKAIGLNPQRTYPFLTKPAASNDTLWITDLPKGAFINVVRHSKGWSVVELGSTGAKQSAVKMTAKLHRQCPRICASDHDILGPLGADREVELTTSIPGGLVFVWEEPAPSDTRFRSQFTAATGRVLAHGVSDRFWSFNGHVRAMDATLDGRPSRP